MGQVFARTTEVFVDRLDLYLTISGLVHLPAIILVVLLVLAIAPTSTPGQAQLDHMVFLAEHHVTVLIISWTQVIASK